ncbi:hypothetical protein GOP47_0027457 [Adiantum capillus-veneris]|nr:hypothetical protein GOP47_0027457 [Adiantum capillus-veneris]
MASLWGCFKPRQSNRLSESGITTIVAKKHSAIAAIITGLSAGNSSSSPEGRFSPNEQQSNSRSGGSRGGSSSPSPVCDGLGILIYPSLLLTTHSTIPSPASAHNAEINLRYSDTSLNILRRRFLPELFFATDSKLNVTVIACEFVNPEMQPLGLDSSKVDLKAYEVGSKVYVLGHDRNRGSPIRLSVGCGYVITKDNAGFMMRSREEAWLRGSAGFDQKGNLALMITDSEMDNDRALRNACVSIHGIKNWLEPQWQATKSGTMPRPRGSLLYTRRATYAGPDAGSAAVDACVKEFDDKRANAGSGKMAHSSSVVVLGNHIKKDGLSRPVEVEQRTRFHDMSRDDAAGPSAGLEDEKQARATTAVAAGKGSTMKNSKPNISSALKEVEVMAKEPMSAMRGKKGSKLSMEKKATSLQNKGGLGKAQTIDYSSRTNSKGKPSSLQQAFQRDRKSLQLRLHDIPIKDKL